MADRAPSLTPAAAHLRFATDRIESFLSLLELIVAGDTERRMPLSASHDELDAIAHGINVMVGELCWRGARALDAQEARAAELRDAVARAERANSAKNIFLRDVSHEIRTPIAAMMGFADLLASSALSHRDRMDLAKRLQTNGQAVLSLVGDLIDLARLDADKMVLTLESVSVFDLLREVLASLDLESRAKGLELRLDASSDALGAFRTDRHRLRQILVNLLANAIKFTESGVVLISLRMARGIDGDRWTIDVADTGIGIAPDRHPYLFEPFEQADSSIARTYGGAGLGLALSRRLAEQLGGTLVLSRSAPGQGSTFRLTVTGLPLTPDSGTASISSSSSGAQTPVPAVGTISGLRILLADDHADMQLAVRRMLEYAGASVEAACDGREAVAKAMASTFDVVLMDLRMPHMDGLQATRILRKNGCTVPIVALTADPAVENRAAALDSGCDECLSKPSIPRDLIASICRLRDRQARSRSGAPLSPSA